MPSTLTCDDPHCPDGPEAHLHTWEGGRITGPAFPPPEADNPWEQVRTRQPNILSAISALRQGLAYVEVEAEALLKQLEELQRATRE